MGDGYLAKLADRSRRYQDLDTRYQLSQRLEDVVAQLPQRLASGALGGQAGHRPHSWTGYQIDRCGAAPFHRLALQPQSRSDHRSRIWCSGRNAAKRATCHQTPSLATAAKSCDHIATKPRVTGGDECPTRRNNMTVDQDQWGREGSGRTGGDG
jgi:hypothetical protein